MCLQLVAVVDIRLRPDRENMGIWVKAKTAEKGIENWLKEAGFGYRSVVELGNVYLDFPDGQQRYSQLLERSGALLTERLDNTPGPLIVEVVYDNNTDVELMIDESEA